jgi:MoaA/NifB/PqqE/SkfB family radical SAM enzyme
VHLLLTYQCTWECDHCFVWSSPRQSGTLKLADLHTILDQARALPSLEWIFLEGGEPFLYYALLLGGARRAKQLGFRVGVVTNAYWATSPEDAIEALRPFAGLLDLVQVSRDALHSGDAPSDGPDLACAAAQELGIEASTISVEEGDGLMYRGRAAVNLTADAPRSPRESFDRCPHEDLRDPGRVHVDPLGFVHLCQGICIGNLFETPLIDICAGFDPDADPVLGPLLRGGPDALAREHDVETDERGHADACHLCYEVRSRLRARFPRTLGPDQAYGSGA